METRRNFVKQSALSAGYTATALGYAANETINIGCIGTGGRCRELMRALQRIAGVKIVAVADIWDGTSPKAASSRPIAFATKEYRELLRRKDIDAVIIGSPNHWHARMTADACAAGKDVYVEKPLTHTIAEGRAVLEAQNRYKRIVQVGTQQRSMPHLIKAREIVQLGPARRRQQGPHDLEPQRQHAAPPHPSTLIRSPSCGRSSSATLQSRTSTSTASATGDGSGISAAVLSAT